MILTVIKRDGREEEFIAEKIERVINFCSNGLDIDLQKFKENFSLTFKPKIKTSEIHNNLINIANQLAFNEKDKSVNKEFSIFANRLFLLGYWKEFRKNRMAMYDLKEEDVDKFGMFVNPSNWIKHLERMVDIGVYDKRILDIDEDVLKALYYKVREMNFLISTFHPLWSNYYHQTLKFKKSYLLKFKNQDIETFEEVWLLISLLGFHKDLKSENYPEYVLSFYGNLRDYNFIPATPQLLNLRRNGGNLSSCNIADIKDNLESIYATITQAALIAKNGGGVGLYGGLIRPSGSYLIGNKGKANNVALWFKLINDTMIAVNQGGMRKGSSTIALPIWYKDVIDFISCKNPLGEQRYKLYDIFPQIVIPDVFIEFLKEGKTWYLIDLYELYFYLKENGREEEFEKYNLPYLSGEELSKAYKEIIEKFIETGILTNYIKIDPVDLLTDIFKNITNSGLPYIFFEDTVNRFSPFKEKILCGNLCMENFSPFNNTNFEGIKPGDCVNEEDIGYIHSCNLFSLNLPKLHENGILFDDKELDNTLRLVLRYMDNILDFSTPPLKEIRKHNRNYRTIGIGFIGLADLFVIKSKEDNKLYSYRFTKRSCKENTFQLLRKVFGRISFYAIKSSVELAKERGFAPKFPETKWKDLILLGRHFVEVKDYSDRTEYDWNDINELANTFQVKPKDVFLLLEDLRKNGIRNTMLLNCPPNTSTSIYAGVSASILPVFNLFTFESQKSASYLTFPKYVDYPLYYDIYSTFDKEDMKDMIEIISFIQQYIDSGISFEYPININIVDKKDIPDYLFTIFMESFNKKVKTLYYGRPLVKKNENGDDCIACAN